jgi:outer membrane protein
MSHRGMRLVFGLGTGLSALLAFSGLATSTAWADKIAIVNIQRAIEDSVEGKAAIGSLKGEVERKQKELEAKKEELKKLDDDLAKQEAVLKPDALQKKKQELQAKFQLLQETAMRAQRELQDKEMKVTGPIQEKVLRAIAQIADRDKFTLVLRQDVVLWPQQSEMDITNEVIRKTNAAKAGGPTPGPATPAAPGPK